LASKENIMTSRFATRRNALAIASTLLFMSNGYAQVDTVETQSVPCAADLSQVPRLTQKGLFTVNVPRSAKESRLKSDDSVAWSWATGPDIVVVSYGFRQLARDAMTLQPCGGSAGGTSLRVDSSKRGHRFLHTAYFLSPIDPTYAVTIHATSNSHRLKPWLAQLISSFAWTGELAQLRVASVAPATQSAVVAHQNNVPFQVRRGDVIAHPWVLLSDVHPDAIVVTDYRKDKLTGDYAEVRRTVPIAR